jgi:hypothetical protein
MDVSSKAFLRKARLAGTGTVLTLLDNGNLGLVTGEKEISTSFFYMRQDRDTYNQFLSFIATPAWGIADNDKDLMRKESSHVK